MTDDLQRLSRKNKALKSIKVELRDHFLILYKNNK